MDLFNPDPVVNLLPYDGTVQYFGRVMSHSEAQFYFDSLMQGIEWKNDEAIMFGKHIVTKRKAAWYGDGGFSYTYSKITKTALPWTEELLALKSLVERLTEASYNSCLLNLYHNGAEGMTWHSDDEKTLGKNSAIASFSFGAARNFAFKHKRDQQTVSVLLEHGSLLLMKDATQTNWLHRLPTTKKVAQPRINLTFRTIVGQAPQS